MSYKYHCMHLWDGCGGLQGDAKERFNEIQQERSQLSTQFSNNLLDATKAFKRLATRKEEVDGVLLPLAFFSFTPSNLPRLLKNIAAY